MIGILLALLSAFAAGLSVVLVRREIEASNFFFTAVALTVVGIILLWPLALCVTDFRTVNVVGVFFFGIAGVLAPGIARLGYYKGMETVGVAINASIFATFPVYSSLLAVVLLGETLLPANWIGIISILTGVVILERVRNNARGQETRGSNREVQARRGGLGFSVLASLAVALAQILRKYALNVYNEPLLGVAIGYSSTFLVYLFPLFIIPADCGSRFSIGDLRRFWKAGIGMTVGWILSFFALSQENVSIVAPLMQTEPLFVLFFSTIILKKIEHVSFEIVLSTIAIVAGATLVSIS